jgi:hypothetical protein
MISALGMLKNLKNPKIPNHKTLYKVTKNPTKIAENLKLSCKNLAKNLYNPRTLLYTPG